MTRIPGVNKTCQEAYGLRVCEGKVSLEYVVTLAARHTKTIFQQDDGVFAESEGEGFGLSIRRFLHWSHM